MTENATITVTYSTEEVAAILHLRQALKDLVASIPGVHTGECACPRCAAQHALTATSGWEPGPPPPATLKSTAWHDDPTDQ